MGEKHKLLFDIWSPLGVFQFCFPDWKKIKNNQKKQTKKKQKKSETNSIAKKRELNAIFCSSISFPVAWIWT